jgi:hypothetical protein
MGQYQQWLHFREVERRLRVDLEALETELAQVQEQLHTLNQTIPLSDNIIIRALAASLDDRSAPSNEPAEHLSGSTSSSTSDAATDQSLETISPALYAWAELPNFGPQIIQEPFSNQVSSVSLTSHPEIALLPEDMVTFFDEHEQTEPQLELPWWFSKIVASANGTQRTGPTDKESMRTNYLVQRWRERWARSALTEQPVKNSEDTQHE